MCRSHWQVDESCAATLNMLRHSPHITAFFGCNDDSALGAMHAVGEHGRRAPHDISIVGFNDSERAEHSIPTLTTMHVDKATMGRLAVHLLANRVEFPHAAPVTTIIRPRLIERESVGANAGIQ